MTKLHQEDVRAKIQASQLVNVLQQHALKGGELAPSRIKAIEILLRKSIADLSSIELTGPGNGPIQVTAIDASRLTEEQLRALSTIPIPDDEEEIEEPDDAA